MPTKPPASDADRAREHQSLRCSFCGKGHDDVWKLIAGPEACICDECIKLCADIISRDPAAKTADYEPPR